MTLLALGINHKTAPVSLRERVSFSPDKLEQALDSLLAQPMVQGGVVLSTCNRTELYLSVEERDDLQEALIRGCVITIISTKTICVIASTGIRITMRSVI